MNARQVYQVPELMSTILGFVDQDSYWKVLILEKSFFRQAVEVLWRDVDHQVAITALGDDSHRNQVYKSAIRQITLSDNEQPRDEESQMYSIISLTEAFPNLIKAQKKSSSRKGKDKYDWKIAKTPQGDFDVTIHSDIVLSDQLSLTRTANSVQDYPGFELDRTYNAILEPPEYDRRLGPANNTTQNDRLINNYTKYLINSRRRNPRITSIYTSDLGLELKDLQRICSFRNKNHLAIREVDSPKLKVFEFSEFEQFCLKCAKSNQHQNRGDDNENGDIAESEIEVLRLDHQYSAKLRLNQIDQIVRLVTESFPNLRYLEIPLTFIAPQGSNQRYIPVSSIPPVKDLTNKLKKLEKFIINIYGNSYGDPDTRYPFPLEDVAKNLASLGADQNCIYEIRNKSDVFIGTNLSRRLNEEVHKFQRLAPDGLIHLHANDTPPAYNAREVVQPAR